jgi:hypothetical protein
MQSLLSFRMLVLFFLSFSTQIFAQSATSSATRPPTPSTSGRPVTNGTSTTPPNVATTSTVPDVYLNVPELHVGRIELTVEKLQADINLNAKVAGLVTVNAGVQLSVDKINITIADVDVQLELVVRLGHLVEIVERVFESLDLNPLLIGLINNVTNLVGDVIGAVDGLLGSITNGGTTLNFLVDNLGNIVQEVVGGATGALSQIVGNFQQSKTPKTLAEKHILTQYCRHDASRRHQATRQRSDPEDVLLRRSERIGRHCVQHGGPGRAGYGAEGGKWRWWVGFDHGELECHPDAGYATC